MHNHLLSADKGVGIYHYLTALARRATKEAPKHRRLYLRRRRKKYQSTTNPHIHTNVSGNHFY
jgi:type IV secretory pathway TrbD component